MKPCTETLLNEIYVNSFNMKVSEERRGRGMTRKGLVKE
jgi:hypothetical protein